MSYATLLQRQVAVRISANRQYAGILRHVGRDYLVLDDEEQGELILPLEHIKQLRAAGTAAPPGSVPNEAAEIPESFHEILRHAQQAVVRLAGAGTGREPMVGCLIETRQDFLTLCTIPEGIIHVPLRHVLALALLDAEVEPMFAEWVDRHREDWGQADSFESLLQKLTGQLIQLGRGSPENLSGILKQLHPETLELVTAPHETVLIPLRHVKAVLHGVRNNLPTE